jgi:hypothetical protein
MEQELIIQSPEQDLFPVFITLIGVFYGLVTLFYFVLGGI